MGEGLLLDALRRLLEIASGLGVHAVQVDAIDDSAASFSRKYGFDPLLDSTQRLFLPIATIEKAMG